MLQRNYLVVLGLGSNVGDTKKNILAAVRKLPVTRKILSPMIKTKALLTKNAPEEWNMDYHNAVVIGRALFGPFETLNRLKKIEKQMKRIKLGKYSPRTIDIDILFWGKAILLEKQLRIPHKEVLNRYFTLKPTVEILPLLRHPICKINMRQALLNYNRNTRRSFTSEDHISPQSKDTKFSHQLKEY
ncbi:2-amino-4-hydroxy-6-hydroxymethyldihydropteridine diphosphokinase [Neorickettsia risticii]|uniref:2-amino-4-hydroxy-6-hydroxymethyldihydropteridine pyrophosphokinase n=1 Tax=Neorickettsia risticii (strain Illinois) TaxID=434131 RepID=C6V4X5_NEORI|nr:2-amino-4-hydroxy-6-hydroxymethyldihydropteridine diphosphokinase [Neorickettsia risticii]ACT69441.1 2-amino-4-hydroxy-6-hydroxymethyldihydropteridine pyrophosphokinase [Neorickettsia risticii str. Illinois]